MSLQCLSDALAADLLEAEASLTLIHLADGAIDGGITVPYLPALAEKVGVDESRLRAILDELLDLGVISPCPTHPFDFVANTEGFKLHLDQVPKIKPVESPIARQFGRVN